MCINTIARFGRIQPVRCPILLRTSDTSDCAHWGIRHNKFVLRPTSVKPSLGFVRHGAVTSVGRVRVQRFMYRSCTAKRFASERTNQ
jgi:hypothetical protein